MSFEVLQGDARNLPLDDDSVDLIVTSPPYFALRSYRDDGEHYDGQIGSEPTPTEFLDALIECTGEMVRVLKPSGSIFVNLGDKYAAGHGGSNTEGKGSIPTVRRTKAHTGDGRDQISDKWQAASSARTSAVVPGWRPKTRMLLPHRYAIRCIDELGLICRMDMVWSKPNGLPESVTDRVRASHEYWFHLVKSPRYFTGIDEIRQPVAEPWRSTGGTETGSGRRASQGDETNGMFSGERVREYNPLGRLPGSVWNIPSEPLLIPDEVRVSRNLPDHFAAFPQEWPRRLILGFSPTGICTECEQPRRAVVDSELSGGSSFSGRDYRRLANGPSGGPERPRPGGHNVVTVSGYECGCAPVGDPAPTRPAVVLDPFGGTGTTAGVAHTLGRHGITVDLSADYCRLAEWRITESGHFDKSRQRMWADRQTQLL